MNPTMSTTWLLPLLQAAWISMVIALLLWAVLAIAKVRHPALRHRAWLGLTLGMMILPFSLAFGPSWELSLLSASPTSMLDEVVAEAWAPARPSAPSSVPPSAVPERSEDDGSAEVESVGVGSETPGQPYSGVEEADPSSPTLLPLALHDRQGTAAVSDDAVGHWLSHGGGAVPPDHGATVSDSGRWWTWAFGIYLLGGAFLAMRLALGWWLGHRLVRRSTPVAAEELRGMCREFLGRRRASSVRLLLNQELASPACIGGGRPTILLPMAWQGWPPAMRRAVLAHELHHLERRDDWVQILALFNRCIFWFHPLAWWLPSHLSQLAERCCDARAVAFSQSPQSYARHLLEVTEDLGLRKRPGLALAVGMSGFRSLQQRISFLLDPQFSTRSASHKVSLAWIVGLASCTLALGALEGAPKVGDVEPPPPSVSPSLEPLGEVMVAANEPHVEPEVNVQALDPEVTLPTVAPPDGVVPTVEVPDLVVPQALHPQPTLTSTPEPVPEPTRIDVALPEPAIPEPVIPQPDDVGPAAEDGAAVAPSLESPINEADSALAVVALHLDESVAPTPATPLVSSTYSQGSGSATAEPAPRPETFDRCADHEVSEYLILVFDDKNRAARFRPRADLTEQTLDDMIYWLTRQFSPCNPIAVVSYRSRLRLHQDFTNDAAALLQGATAAQRSRHPKTSNPGPSGDGIALADLLSPRALKRQSIYRVLQEIAAASEQLPAPVEVVMVTPGFDENNHFSEEYNSVAQRSRMEQLLRKSIAALTEAETVVHVINPWPMWNRHGAELLTKGTGGDLYHGFEAPMEGSVYSLK